MVVHGVEDDGVDLFEITLRDRAAVGRRCLNWLLRLGFAFKRPKKRLLKADEEKREAFVAAYAALAHGAKQSGGKIFFVDEAHFQADAELRGKWVLRGEPALVDSSSPRYGEKASGSGRTWTPLCSSTPGSNPVF